MDEKDQHLGFTLEDILKEFGSPEHSEQPPAVQQPPVTDDAPDWEDNPIPESVFIPEQMFVPEETVPQEVPSAPESPAAEEPLFPDVPVTEDASPPTENCTEAEPVWETSSVSEQAPVLQEVLESEADLDHPVDPIPSQPDVETPDADVLPEPPRMQHDTTDDLVLELTSLLNMHESSPDEVPMPNLDAASLPDLDAEAPSDYDEVSPVCFDGEPSCDFEEEPPPRLDEETPRAAAEAPDEEDDEDTIRLDTPKILAEAGQNQVQTDDETHHFDPVEPEPEQIPQQPPLPEGAEPFGSGWEPEYEQPAGEYTAPEPIVFRPRTQAQSLKRKLVAGPERRYYALAEQGLGKLQTCIFLNLFVVILGIASIGMYHFGMIQPNRMRLLVFGELFAMLLSALLASGCLVNGFVSLFKGRFNLDTLLLSTFLVCMADGYFCLQEVRVPFCATFSLQASMALWAEFQRRSTEMGQMDTLRKASRLNRVAKAPGCFEDRPGFYITQGELEDFTDTYEKNTGGEKLVNLYALIALLVTGAIALVTGLSNGISSALQIWSAGLLAAAPATIFISQSRPMAILERRLHKLDAVMCGWQGIKATTGAAAVPLTDWNLFPAGSVKINGVKFYTNQEPDLVIAYAAALFESSGNCLSPLFEQLREQRNGRHFDVQNYRSYASGGLGGEVNGESILIGTISFLQEMGVETPEGTRVNQAVYLAIDAELCAVFALAFGKLKGVSAGLGTLCNYRGLTPVLTSENFLLSESFIRAKFAVNTRRLAFPSMQERSKVAAWAPDISSSVPCALMTQDSLAGYAYAITGGRAVYTASMLGAIIHILGGVLGLLIVLALAIVHSGVLLTPSNLLLFQLIWTIPGLLITEWTRNI